MAGRAVSLTIKVLADTANAQKGLKDAGGGVEVFGKKLDTGMIAKGAAVAGAVGLAVVAITDMTKAAAADAAEQDRLMLAYQAAGAGVGDYTAAIDAAIVAGQEKAFTDTEIRDALVPLIAVTGDAQLANEQLALAQDVARLKGVDLATAAKAVAKAQDGSATALGKLIGINAKGMTSTEVLTQAQKLAAGQAEAYGNTTAGQAKAMGIGFDELQETIGSAFLPVLAEILPVLKPILGQFAELIKALLPVLIPLIKLLIIPLKLLVTVISAVARVLAPMIEWLIKAISVVGDFLAALGPVQAAAGWVGGLFAGGQMVAPVPPAPVPAAATRGVATRGGSVPGRGRSLVSGSVTVTHRIEDTGGALAGLPGGAAAVASLLNRGTDATGLYRNLQHAAGLV